MSRIITQSLIRIYDIIITYRSLQKYEYNVVSENMYLHADAEGYQYQLMDEILDRITNGHAVCGDSNFITSRSGRHVWVLMGNYLASTMVIVIYHHVERIGEF